MLLADVPGLLPAFEALGPLSENAKRNLQSRSQASYGSPSRVLAAAFKMGDPRRMQRRTVCEFLLAKSTLETQLLKRGAQSMLRFGSAGHRRHRPGNVRGAP